VRLPAGGSVLLKKPAGGNGKQPRSEEEINEMNKTLQTPTPSLVQKYVTDFENDSECVATDAALTLLVNTFRQNRAIEEVLLKVAAINQLYNAGVRTTAIYSVAKLICKLDIDPKIVEGSLDVVNEIAYSIIGENDRYAFATKYCHWHRPDAYPIYDSKAEAVLLTYQRADGFAQFKKYDLRKYPLYKEVVEKFRNHYGLTGVSFRQLDKFLWRYEV
jgi:hypothetical protein